jgi:hypothetical protein
MLIGAGSALGLAILQAVAGCPVGQRSPHRRKFPQRLSLSLGCMVTTAPVATARRAGLVVHYHNPTYLTIVDDPSMRAAVGRGGSVVTLSKFLPTARI